MTYKNFLIHWWSNVIELSQRCCTLWLSTYIGEILNINCVMGSIYIGFTEVQYSQLSQKLPPRALKRTLVFLQSLCGKQNEKFKRWSLTGDGRLQESLFKESWLYLAQAAVFHWKFGCALKHKRYIAYRHLWVKRSTFLNVIRVCINYIQQKWALRYACL